MAEIREEGAMQWWRMQGGGWAMRGRPGSGPGMPGKVEEGNAVAVAVRPSWKKWSASQMGSPFPVLLCQRLQKAGSGRVRSWWQGKVGRLWEDVVVWV